jgi:hypothetical protein
VKLEGRVLRVGKGGLPGEAGSLGTGCSAAAAHV